MFSQKTLQRGPSKVKTEHLQSAQQFPFQLGWRVQPSQPAYVRVRCGQGDIALVNGVHQLTSVGHQDDARHAHTHTHTHVHRVKG